MLFGRSAGHKQVVNVCIAKGQAMKDLINEVLKRLCCVPQPKRHAYKLEKAKWSGDSRFRDIIWLYRYLMVRANEIYLGEDTSAVERGSN